ncbi:uncharacterized protein LOC105211009 [Zeugodacus cucurbitae]|uniref:uncharacterized protein LOC105211009 n=1 Tax=Zeugodacus cucurbitae TaxID=28588 RepID=UPI0023D9317D|nr:uncharacterized protein LOC105211009 [Zeugodacus cucurbitae]XP_054085540.1 uncharacterized protein LOC105211009 [Zeugodacus cucurbitae]
MGEIAKKLNAIGSPERCRTELKRVFCHLKARTRRKLVENVEAGFTQHQLTEPEKTLSDILKIVEPIKPSSAPSGVSSVKLSTTSKSVVSGSKLMHNMRKSQKKLQQPPPQIAQLRIVSKNKYMMGSVISISSSITSSS